MKYSLNRNADFLLLPYEQSYSNGFVGEVLCVNVFTDKRYQAGVLKHSTSRQRMEVLWMTDITFDY